MFLEESKSNKDDYLNLLTKVGSLSNLFSESAIPYLHYRIAENIFCRAFKATNYSRSDTSADAGKNGVGFGIKTFLNNNGKTYQKVAEFNKHRDAYFNFTVDIELFVRNIAKLRNARIEFAKESHNLENILYHCVAREEGRFIIFEEPMDFVDLDNIFNVKQTNNSIAFSDGLNDYTFNLSKSTLLKRFVTKRDCEFEVNIYSDPFEIINQLSEISGISTQLQVDTKESIILPLYSPNNKEVQTKSGLNQWNALGRERDPDEVYIPIPAWIHKAFPSFFPERDKPFNLKLPSSDNLIVKVCQDGSKALMSNPNKALGKWLLRKLLKVPEGEILTYQKLIDIGIDSVEITKINQDNFEIDFKVLGSY
jgi:hypothetical protein